MKRHFSWLMLSVLVVIGQVPARAAVSVDQWSPIIDSLDEQHRTYSVAAMAHADGLLQVSIKRVDGTPLYQSVYPVIGPDGGKRLEWTYYHADGMTWTQSNVLPAEISPTIRAMSLAGKDIVRMAANGLQPGSRNPKPGKIKTDDAWGCDLPEFADFECTSLGNCCDSHDACYEAGDCSVWSWLGVQTLWCEACNATIVLCITAGVGSTGAPSVCCQYGNCGVERCLLDPFSPYCGRFNGIEKQMVPLVQPTNGDLGGLGYVNPWVAGGTTGTGSGTCTFPDGTVLPCG